MGTWSSTNTEATGEDQFGLLIQTAKENDHTDYNCKMMVTSLSLMAEMTLFGPVIQLEKEDVDNIYRYKIIEI